MTDFESKESLLSDSTSSYPKSPQDSPKSSRSQLIPPYIRDMCKTPKYAELRVSYDAPTQQSTITYSITWDEPPRADIQQIEDSSSSSTTTSETNCSMSAESTASTRPIFRLIYPSNNEIIGVKLVIVESFKREMKHTFAKLEVQADTKMSKVLEDLLARKSRDPKDYLEGTLYYVELQPDCSRKLRRIRHTEKFERLTLACFPQIAEHIFFVLDMGEFVKNDIRISLE